MGRGPNRRDRNKGRRGRGANDGAPSDFTGVGGRHGDSISPAVLDKEGEKLGGSDPTAATARGCYCPRPRSTVSPPGSVTPSVANPLIIALVAPLLVSKKARDTSSEHGGRGVVVGTVRDTTARTVVLEPVPPVLLNGRRIGEVCPAVTVNA